MEAFKIKALSILLTVRQLLDLKTDFDEAGTYETIRSGVEFKSGNAWGLIFAIFIASIGLLANSTAVIIGAMLISPLMGPIVGSGYALGTHDFDLLKKSVTNLIYAVVISILTSTIFFLIAPNQVIQSELLARTQPTFTDVMIAFFGGAAGIVANTRKAKGNAIPGVAIATALMPPLCTVGYGLAQFKISYILGALYLFLINATFILISTYLFIRLLGFKQLPARSSFQDQLIHKSMTWASIIIIVPSVIMAWYLNRKTQFDYSASVFVNEELQFKNTLIASKELIFDISKPKIKVLLFGEPLTAEATQTLTERMKQIPSLRQTELVLEFIERDRFTTNDLEEKFVTKEDLQKIIALQTKEKSDNFEKLKMKSPEIIAKVNRIYANALQRSTLNEGAIEFVWNKKPTQQMILTAEKIALELFLGHSTPLLHSVALPPSK